MSARALLTVTGPMSETCFYHPKARASASCPACQQLVCDRCRADGDFTTCGTCIQMGPGAGVTPELLAAQAAQPQAEVGAYVNDAYTGGYEGEAGYGASYDQAAEGYEEPTCSVHPHLPAEMQCMNCFRPFCLNCCPSGYCPECAPQMSNRVQQQLSYQPTGGSTLEDVGASYEVLEDLSAGYDEIQESAPAPRPRRPKQGGGGKKGGTKGLKGQGGKGAPAKGKKAPPKRKGAGPNWGLIAGGFVALLVVGGGGYGAYQFLNQPPPPVVQVTAKVDFVKPAAGAALTGVQVVQVKVASPEAAKMVELTINGRYWNKWKPPISGTLSTEWPTALPQFRRGPQKLQVVVEYESGQKANAKRDVSTRN